MGLKKHLISSKKLITILPIVLFSIFFIGVCVFIYIHREIFWCQITRCDTLFENNERIEEFLTSFGFGAPIIFIMLQTFQVVFAPIPGEASGVIGGYLFGTLPGMIYSTIGLSIGSWFNILIGRSFGKQFVRRLISDRRLIRFDRILKRQGVIVFFIMFLFPGFPKDYLCFFLGLSNVPIRILVFIASVGRIPGTFLLSLQGEYLFERNYILLLVVILLCLVLALISYRHKEKIYDWVDKYNDKDHSDEE